MSGWAHLGRPGVFTDLEEQDRRNAIKHTAQKILLQLHGKSFKTAFLFRSYMMGYREEFKRIRFG